MVNVALRVTATVGSCTIRRGEYDIGVEDGGEAADGEDIASTKGQV